MGNNGSVHVTDGSGRGPSGHSTHPIASKNLMELDPDKFAISPSVSLLTELGGAFHATEHDLDYAKWHFAWI